LYTAVKDLKAIASPLALIVLGGQFEFSAVKGMTKEIIVGTAWRIVIAPLIGIGVAFLLSRYTDLFTFGTDIYPTLIALFGTPVAVSSAIMAGEMKSDEQLATQLVVWTSICSIVTIFVTVFILMAGGLLVV
ncbi:MAG: AEC family transporter, partial [Clostridia bacterium]|nr:AEC family transporter [Clostridia bacterium]